MCGKKIEREDVQKLLREAMVRIFLREPLRHGVQVEQGQGLSVSDLGRIWFLNVFETFSGEVS